MKILFVTIFVLLLSAFAGGDSQAMAIHGFGQKEEIQKKQEPVYSFSGRHDARGRQDEDRDQAFGKQKDDEDFRGHDLLTGLSGLSWHHKDKKHHVIRHIIAQPHHHGWNCHKPDAPSSVPLPAALPLFGLGLAGLGAARLRSKKK